MKENLKRLLWFLPGVFLLLAILQLPAVAQTAPATSVVNYPGAGVLQVGDLWESFLPQGWGPYYSEASAANVALGRRQFIRMGNFDRNWTTPGSHWPHAFPWTMFWAKYMHSMTWNPDTNWNRLTIGTASNPSYHANSGNGRYSNYANLTFKPGVVGSSDATRYYTREPYYVDPVTRQHAVYEAGWPTNVGIDVKVRMHAFQGPNWNNFNDFVLFEISFKNTGVRDMNMDGTAEATTDDIYALTLNIAGEIFMSVSSYSGGGRSVNSISTKFTRMGGWVADPDPEGNPWAFNVYYPGASTQTPTAGNFDFGFNAPTIKSYTDTWNGWAWIAAKEGGLPTDPDQFTASQVDKSTVFGTHAVGVGAQRGWYVSAGSGGGLGASFSNPRQMHTISMGTFYKDGGSSRTPSNLSREPNPAFFQAGIADDIRTFVPKPIPSQPTGDQKTLNTFDQTPFEDGKASATTNYANGWGKWIKGYNFAHDFNGDNYSGIGPFRIPKDSTITIVLSTVGGYRLEGIQKAVRAARWSYANRNNIPKLPALPKVKVSNTLTKSVRVEWDNAAESDAGFAGYKIWKASSFKHNKWLEDGLRLSDRYQEQMAVGESRDQYKKPVNPKFDAFSAVSSASQKGEYQPDTWGDWELLKVVSKAQLGTLSTSTTSGYKYLLEDKDVVLGFSYFYYISAYKEGTFNGPGGETTSRIETHSTNRNGATGLWQKTFPFGNKNANFPKTAQGLQDIGAVQIVYSALAPAGDVASVGVRPNPYKRAALHDNISNAYDHKLLFYNLPPDCKITILDVSGQIIDEIRFASTNANQGSTFWDMFSKDGIEVASGLYIYVVESPTGGQKVGYFSILR